MTDGPPILNPPVPPDRLPLRIGTRGSPLALAQASEVRARLMAAHDLPEGAFTVAVISTSGDRILDRPLSEVGGKGLFTKEIEDALLDGRIDMAVHSAKDMATRLPEGLRIAAVLPREDVRDVFIGRGGLPLAALPPGATVGSASLRRQALLRRLRPDLRLVIFRGNVQSRLRKLEAGEVDGTMLALAGLNRLAQGGVATEVMDAERFPPAPGQGVIAVESRTGDAVADRLLGAIGDAATACALAAERAFLAELDGSCRTPIAALGTLGDGRLRFHGLILTPDGAEMHETHRSGPPDEAAAIGQAAARLLLDRAGAGFFAGWNGSSAGSGTG